MYPTGQQQYYQHLLCVCLLWAVTGQDSALTRDDSLNKYLHDFSECCGCALKCEQIYFGPCNSIVYF